MPTFASLTALGFTEYEARVYLALLDDYPATGYQLSKGAGVPRSMVYEALGRLNARGAVLQSVEGKATLYRPLAPNALLDRLQRDHQQHIDALRKTLNPRYEHNPDDRMWTIQDYQGARAYAVEMLQGAKHDLGLILNDHDLEILRPALLDACGRKVEAQILLTGRGDLDCGQVARHPPRESELQHLTHSLVVVADEREALIASGQSRHTATVTRDENLVLFVRQFIWMELFAQRVYARLGPELLAQLEPQDRRVFEGFLPGA